MSRASGSPARRHMPPFGWPLLASAAVLAGAGALGGLATVATVAVLGVLEISMSFDNAVVDATVLRRLGPFWQRLYLTLGVLVAVAGMRLLFPLAIVTVTARLSPVDALRLAVSRPAVYAHDLAAARPTIAAFGGMFLLMIFLEFVFDDREVRWLGPVERVLARVGRLDSAAPVAALLGLLVCAHLGGGRHADTVLVAGVLGMVVFLLVNGLGSLVGAHAGGEIGGAPHEPSAGRGAAGARLAGRAALVAFLYLELLDASFSFDGVIGAFAISTNLFAIAAGLGIGAVYVRTLTVRLVRRGTMAEYAYLEHGAHYAIGALGVVLLATLAHPAPEYVTGGSGVCLIAAALASSVVRNRRAARRAAEVPAPAGAPAEPRVREPVENGEPGRRQSVADGEPRA